MMHAPCTLPLWARSDSDRTDTHCSVHMALLDLIVNATVSNNVPSKMQLIERYLFRFGSEKLYNAARRIARRSRKNEPQKLKQMCTLSPVFRIAILRDRVDRRKLSYNHPAPPPFSAGRPRGASGGHTLPQSQPAHSRTTFREHMRGECRARSRPASWNPYPGRPHSAPGRRASTC